MGFIRGLLFVFVSIILMLSVLSSGILYTISSSLKYETVQKQALNVVQPLIEQINLAQQINSSLPIIKQYCQYNLNYIINYQGYTFRFPCSDVNDTSRIINDTVKNFVDDLYYKQYDCNYWDCFSKYSPIFLISEKSELYWLGLFYYALAISVISALILFILFRRKYDLLFLSGGVVIFSSILVIGIGKIISLFSNQIISSVALLFFSQSNFVFIRMLIIGFVLIFAGLIVELFRAGFKIYDMFSRFGHEEEVKEKPDQKKKK